MKPGMVWRSAVMLALAWVALGSANALAAEADTHEGLVVSAASGKLSMSCTDGKQQSYDIGDTVKITVNGHMGKLEDLKAGARIRVTTDKAGRALNVATVDTTKGSLDSICSN